MVAYGTKQEVGPGRRRIIQNVNIYIYIYNIYIYIYIYIYIFFFCKECTAILGKHFAVTFKRIILQFLLRNHLICLRYTT